MSDVIQLKEVANMLAGFAIKGSDFGIGESLAVKIKNVLPPKVDVQTLDSFKPDRYGNKIQRYRLNKGDVLISMTGNLGRVATVPEHERPIYLNQRVAKLLAQSESDTTFLKYQLINPSFAEYCDAFADSATAQPNISVKTMLGYSLVWPKKDIRDAMAEVLSSIDDKIDLLNRQNETLEAMAQTLFRQWFIEEADDSWEELPITSVAHFLNGLACQKFPPLNDSDRLPVLKIRDLKDGLSDTSDYASRSVDPKYIIDRGDVIFSWSASLVVKFWNGDKCVLNQHLFKVTSELYPKWFYYFWCKHHLTKFIAVANAHATTMGHIKRSDLDNAMVIVPDQAELNRMSSTMDPIIEKLLLNSSQISSLRTTRDSLLPKLMSGEVRVKLN